MIQCEFPFCAPHHPCTKPCERNATAVVQRVAPKAAPKPVAWLSRVGLLELARCNGMSIWAESPEIWPPSVEATPPTSLVPVYAQQPKAVDPQHVYALERAVRQMRAIAARLGRPDDPYGGLMHAEDADLLEALLAVLDPTSALPVVERVVEINPADVAVEIVYGQQGGFGPVRAEAIKLTHTPTGITVKEACGKGSGHRARATAFEKLARLISNGGSTNG